MYFTNHNVENVSHKFNVQLMTEKRYCSQKMLVNCTEVDGKSILFTSKWLYDEHKTIRRQLISGFGQRPVAVQVEAVAVIKDH